MTDDQKAAFRDMMNLVMQTYGKQKPDVDLLRMWWAKLERYEIADVCKALDTWIDTKTHAPTPADIIELCRHKVTIHPRLPSPLNVHENREHAKEIKNAIENMTQPKRDMRAWAKKILANPRNYPDIAVRFAHEAMGKVVDAEA